MFREKKELFLESNGLEIVYWEKFRKNNRVNESRTGNRGYIINRSIVNIIFPRGIFLLDGGKKNVKITLTVPIQSIYIPSVKTIRKKFTTWQKNS